MKYRFGPTSWLPDGADPAYMAYHFSFNGYNYFVCNDLTVEPYDHRYSWTPDLTTKFPLPEEVKTMALLWLKTWTEVQPVHEFLTCIYDDQTKLD